MLSFSLRGGFDAVKRVLPRLRLAHLAANLGAVETLAGVPATTSHVECTAEERAALGIPEGLVRYSVGIEDARGPDRRPRAGVRGGVGFPPETGNVSPTGNASTQGGPAVADKQRKNGDDRRSGAGRSHGSDPGVDAGRR